MHARVTTVSIQPDNVAETSRIFNESIVPAVKAAAGNRGIFLLADEATGKVMAISLWDSQAIGDAYAESEAYQELIGKVRQFFTAPASLAAYTVTAQG
jgi:quinol monooxygenase YgiN